MAITAADVAKLRKITGAGMMDCKKALEDAAGDYDKAVEIIRKKGQMVANKRADRDASEGCVIAVVNDNQTSGVLVALNCETDFVAKNEDFVSFTQTIASAALEAGVADVASVLPLKVGKITVAEGINDRLAAIGEKIELSFFKNIQAAQVVAYIHPGNKLACLVGFSKPLPNAQVGKDIAMQIAAMNPVAVDKDAVAPEVVAKEKEIALDQTANDPRNANKPVAIQEKIAEGKLEKFFKENTLMNQEFIKDSKKTVGQYLSETDKELKVTGFVRLALSV